jgi:hypothetical protein
MILVSIWIYLQRLVLRQRIFKEEKIKKCFDSICNKQKKNHGFIYDLNKTKQSFLCVCTSFWLR